MNLPFFFVHQLLINDVEDELLVLPLLESFEVQLLVDLNLVSDYLLVFLLNLPLEVCGDIFELCDQLEPVGFLNAESLEIGGVAFIQVKGLDIAGAVVSSDHCSILESENILLHVGYFKADIYYPFLDKNDL